MTTPFETVEKYINSIWSLDEKSFQEIISCDAVLQYTINGEPIICRKDHFINKLGVGHFNNTIKSDIIHISITKADDSKYYVQEKCILERKGFGFNEEFGQTKKYYYDSHGYIYTENSKISKIDYHFKKSLI